MICEICGIREATIKFTQVVNKVKKQLNLCKVCAEEKGLTNPLSAFPKLIGGLILGIVGEWPEALRRESLDLKCRNCELTWQEFQTSGLLGCSECYESFIEPLKNLLRKMHGSNKHIGTRPVNQRQTGSAEDIEKLRKELARAIQAENYERAAKLRDRIRDIEANLQG